MYMNMYIYMYISYICISSHVLVVPPAPWNQSSMSSQWPRAVARQKNLLTALPKVQLLSAALPLKKCWMTFLDCR